MIDPSPAVALLVLPVIGITLWALFRYKARNDRSMIKVMMWTCGIVLALGLLIQTDGVLILMVLPLVIPILAYYLCWKMPEGARVKSHRHLIRVLTLGTFLALAAQPLYGFSVYSSFTAFGLDQPLLLLLPRLLLGWSSIFLLSVLSDRMRKKQVWTRRHWRWFGIGVLAWAWLLNSFIATAIDPWKAAAEGSPVTIAYLMLSRPGTCVARRNRGVSPLGTAITHNRMRVVKMWYWGAGFAHDVSGGTALHQVVRHGNLEMAEYLLNRGMRVDAPNLAGRPPIHLAAGMGQADMVRLLLRHGADPGVVDRNGWTAKKWAVNYGHLDVVTILDTRDNTVASGYPATNRQ